MEAPHSKDAQSLVEFWNVKIMHWPMFDNVGYCTSFTMYLLILIN